MFTIGEEVKFMYKINEEDDYKVIEDKIIDYYENENGLVYKTKDYSDEINRIEEIYGKPYEVVMVLDNGKNNVRKYKRQCHSQQETE